ncbi:MAG: ycjS [Verrucomicrobiales bacterium]|nr:ycjS [Verrucomicrobiales bacterium]
MQSRAGRTLAKPRLGFLGVGWIGRKRMEAIAQSGYAEITAIADPASALLREAACLAPEAAVCPSLSELLKQALDGIVIATPSALHPEQACLAIEQGMPVFCQKPLGRNLAENARVIETARAHDKLLGVDLSYRFIDEVRAVTDLVRNGELGEVYAVDITFHNAYGPDKPWFYDPKLSGGGCVIDLGIHLVDLVLWTFGFPNVNAVTSRLFAQGKPLISPETQVEDYAVARIDLENGAAVQLACSWKLHAGCDAIISGAFYGTKGGAQFRNVNGSFVDFIAERYSGTRTERLSACQSGWGGRAAVHWARRLSEGRKFDPEIENLLRVAEVLDAIYGRSQESRPRA